LEFYLYNHAFFSHITLGHFLYILFGGIKFDTVAILYSNLLFIFLHVLPFPFRYNKKYQSVLFYVFVITNSLALLANFVDYIYYPFTLKRTTFSVFHEFIHERNIGPLAIKFITDYWHVTLLYALTIWCMIWAYRKIKVKAYKIPNIWIYYSVGLIFFLLSITLFIGGVRGGYKHSTRPITLSNAGDYASNPNEMHIILNTPFSIFKTIEIKSLERLNYYPDSTLANIYNPIKQPHPKGAFKPMNVVIIIVESLGRENLGFFNKDLDNGKYKGYTPFLDSLCAHSLIFWDAFANGHKSIEALPSVLSSIPSIQEPFVLTDYYDNKIPSLPRLLKEKGYNTSFFHGAPNGSMGFSAFTKMIGIDQYYGLNEYGNKKDFDGMWGIWDEPFLQFMCDKLNTFPQPFMSCVFTVSSHHPFRLPEKYKGKFPEGPNPIHRTIGYTDYSLRRFFNTASHQPWFKNTLFVITADHCNSKPVYDVYLTPVGLYSIPIIFYSGSDTLKGIHNELIQQTDIMPTILGLLNYDKKYFSFGFDVLNEKDRFVVNYTNESCQLFQKDLVLQFHKGDVQAVYNFKSDRLLNHDLKETFKDSTRQMEALVKAFMQQYSNRMIDNKLEP
jgi:phosphoglycerol transferase MdoB-like AlkP superfamily enzyme